jgi:hypothetical protein
VNCPSFLQAIHDLLVYEPSVFVPAFTKLLPSLLDNLLAPRLAQCTQACHALRSLALSASQIPLSYTHMWLSETIVAALTFITAPSTTSSPVTPSTSIRLYAYQDAMHHTHNTRSDVCSIGPGLGTLYAHCPHSIARSHTCDKHQADQRSQGPPRSRCMPQKVIYAWACICALASANIGVLLATPPT